MKLICPRKNVCLMLILLASALYLLAMFLKISRRESKNPRLVKISEETMEYLSEGYKTLAFGTPFFQGKWKGETEKFPNDAVFKNCSTNKCILVDDVKYADAVMFHAFDLRHVHLPSIARRPEQFWIYFTVESPLAPPDPGKFNNIFNWTATYKKESDIFIPYGFTEPLTAQEQKEIVLQKDYTKGKTKFAFIVSSNCQRSLHSQRWQYIGELQKYIDIDIYGVCGGGLICDDCSAHAKSTQYKFYLAFESAKCVQYITEKFWYNGLMTDVVPVVLGGASKEDYLLAAPPNSYIAVANFTSPKALAQYLKEVNSNNALYNQYFQWKKKYKIVSERNEENFDYCQICKALHNSTKTGQKKVYRNMESFWNVSKDCLGAERLKYPDTVQKVAIGWKEWFLNLLSS